MKNKILAFLLVSVMTASVCACGTTANTDQTSTDTESSSDQEAGMANPVHESDEKGVTEETGIDLPTPEGAENVSYSYIDMEDGQPIAQMDFVYNGTSYYLRAQATSETELFAAENDPDASVEDIMSSTENSALDISGLYYEWDATALTLVGNCDAVYKSHQGSDGNASVLIWLDTAPGIVYNLSTTEEVDQSTLEETANAVFVSTQGES